MNKDSLFTDSLNSVGTWISIGHPTITEISANLEFDFLLIDTEHTPLDLQTVENMIRGVEATDETTTVVIRVPDNDPVPIKRVLDLGITTVMVPMVETATEAREVVDSVLYPPEGNRGVASGRATEHGARFEEYVENANDLITTIVQIETPTGIENVDEIAAIDGVDALFVGPSDLSASMDAFGELSSNSFEEAVEHVIDCGQKNGVPVGTLTVDPDGIKRCVDQGFDFLIISKDTASLIRGSREALDRYDQIHSQAQRTTEHSSR